MLRQNESLEEVVSHGPVEKHLRSRLSGDPTVVEYHTDDYFVRIVRESGEWLVKWYSSGAHPLGTVTRTDDYHEAREQAHETVSNILAGARDPRPD